MGHPPALNNSPPLSDARHRPIYRMSGCPTSPTTAASRASTWPPRAPGCTPPSSHSSSSSSHTPTGSSRLGTRRATFERGKGRAKAWREKDRMPWTTGAVKDGMP
eukprot:scaffold10373_cov118-Isochrysis_galbana.AAC.17